MMTKTFRTAFRSDLRIRLIDAAGHAALAILLPGPWILQYAADAALPFVFGASLITNRLLQQTNPVLCLHKALHSPVWIAFWLAAGMWMGSYLMLCLSLHWACHLFLDELTHDRWREYDVRNQ
jgi:hypothetical protein